MSAMAATRATGALDPSFDSPAAPALIGGIAALAFAAGLLIWAGTTSVSGGAVSPGQVAVEGSRKAVQHRDGGAIKAVLVREGQEVAKGQPLVELETSDLRTDVEVMSSGRLLLLARLSRLRAEAMGAAAVQWPAELSSARRDPQRQGIIDQEQSLFAARSAAYRGNISLLQGQIDGRERQIKGLEGRLVAIQAQLKSVDEELASLAPLVARGLIARPRTTTLERTSAGLRGDVETTQAAIAAERNGIAQAQTQIAQLEKDRRELIQKESAEAEAKLAEVEPKLAYAQERLQRAVITAPEAGHVFGLAVFNSGAVVTPGQTVLEIVPASEPLVLSVEIGPKDVDWVRPGQEVVVHLLPYKQRDQAMIKGTLTKVSADRFDDKYTQRSFFKGTVKVDEEDLKRSRAELVPGMPAQVVIETQKRTILAYFLDPIYKMADYGLREK
jgi:HlyD family type I secretion membrane fusion protein